VTTTPAITLDGDILVASYPGGLTAVKADGSLYWNRNIPVFQSPVPNALKDIFCGGTNLEVTAWNGGNRWSVGYNTSSYSSPAIWTDGTTIFGAGAKFYAFSAGGSIRWSYTSSTNENFGNSSPAFGPDGTAYTGASYGQDGWLIAFDSYGKVKWKAALNGMAGSMAIGRDGNMYVMTADNRIHAVSPAGVVLWSFFGAGALSTPVVAGDGTIWVGAGENRFYAVNPDGTKKAEFAAPGPLGSPAIGADGTLYFGSTDGNLYAFGNPP
jgi:outer membrane protein assembly factor BamB